MPSRYAVDVEKRGDGERDWLTVTLNGQPVASESARATRVHSLPPEWANPDPPPYNQDGQAVDVFSEVTAKAICSYGFTDIAPAITMLSLPVRPTWNPFIDRIYLTRRTVDDTETLYVTIQMLIWPIEWASPYTVPEFEAALHQAAAVSHQFVEVNLFGMWPQSSSDADDEEHSGTYWQLGFCSPVDSQRATLSEAIETRLEDFRLLCDLAVREILRGRKDAVVTFFDFPQAVRSACEQYLIYFVQFLEDLGINARSELRDEAGAVMFTIVPTDETSALTAIRRALDIYLRLATSSDLERSAPQDSGIAVAQLRANVLFLRSQLELGRAALQAKDAAIQALDFTVFQQRQLLTGTKINSEAGALAKRDEEPFLGDAVYLTPYEGKGFRIDLPSLLRRLKRTLRGQRR